jgi:hypothetical protein
MTSLTTEIVGLSVAYALVGVLLLTACLFTRLPWPLKAGGIILTSIFYVVSFYAARGLLGWSSIDPLPPRFKLLHARIVEPHSLAGDPGAIHLWIETIDDDNRPSGVPRAYRLPYNAKLAERAEAAIKASANGSPRADARPMSALAKAVRARSQRGKLRRVRSPQLAAAILQPADLWIRE